MSTSDPLDDVEIGRRLAAHLRAQGLVDDAALARAGEHFRQGKKSADALVLAGVPVNVVDDALIALGISDDSRYARTIVESTLLTPPPPKPLAAPAPITLDAPPAASAPPPQTRVEAPPPPPKHGASDIDRIGPWRVEKLLGQGGMARVFLAVDDKGRRAAVKVVHKHLLELEPVRQRFMREARATMRVRHKNIVEVLDVGEGDDAYLAVEYIDGGTVGRLLRRVGPLPVAAAIEIFAQMMEGLAAAHAQGVIHRDLKPDNLLVGSDGVIKIADFGIARELDATAMTQTGSTLGTPTYMSPEQVKAKDIDARSDLYTAGVILYVLLVGRNPFEAESLGAVVSQILGGKAPPLFEVVPAVPDPVGNIVAALMAQNPADRPQNAMQVLELIKPFVDEERARHPGFLPELLKHPQLAAEARRAQAQGLVSAGRELLQMGPNAREAAGLCLYKATLLDHSNSEAVKLLEGLAKDQGVHFNETKNPKLIEVLQQLERSPDDPILLQRAGALYKQEGNVYKAAVFFRRYLRLRPDDAYVAGQLTRMTMMPPGHIGNTTGAMPAQSSSPGSQGASGTVDRIAGHVATGGFAASPPVAPGGRPAPGSAPGSRGVPPAPGLVPGSSAPALKVVDPTQRLSAIESNIDSARASFSVHGKKVLIAAGLLVGLVVVVKAVGGFISGAQDDIDNARFSEKMVARPTDVDEEKSGHAQKLAAAALEERRFEDAVRDATTCLDTTKKPFRASRCLVLRGEALIGLNRPLAAVEDLTRVVNAYKSEEAFSEALIRRGQAHAAAGDADHAIQDFTRAIDNRPQPNWVALARLERGIAYASKGETGKARMDLERASDLTAPNTPVHKRALHELAKLP